MIEADSAFAGWREGLQSIAWRRPDARPIRMGHLPGPAAFPLRQQGNSRGDSRLINRRKSVRECPGNEFLAGSADFWNGV
jgi:hypothetical protein